MPVRGRNGGNAGQGSKWISKKTRHRIYARDGWRCVWCGCEVHDPKTFEGSAAAATLDHVIPRSCSGTNVVSNLITCCMRCNRERGERTAMYYACSKPTSTAWGYEARPLGDAHAMIERLLEAVCKPLPPVAASRAVRADDNVA